MIRIVDSIPVSSPCVSALGGGDPAAIFGDSLVAWYKAVAADLTLSGTDVTAWAAHQGTGPDMDTVSGTPDWNSSDSNLGGHGSVSFVDASSELLKTSSWGLVPDGDDVPFTVSWVHYVGGFVHNDTMWSVGNSADDATYLRFATFTGSDRWIAEKLSGTPASRLETTTSTDTNPHYFTWVDDGTTGELFIDGTSVSSGSTDENIMIGNVFCMGALSRTTDALHSDVTFGELLFIDRAISTAERTDLERYLASEHGL